MTGRRSGDSLPKTNDCAVAAAALSRRESYWIERRRTARVAVGRDNRLARAGILSAIRCRGTTTRIESGEAWCSESPPARQDGDDGDSEANGRRVFHVLARSHLGGSLTDIDIVTRSSS